MLSSFYPEGFQEPWWEISQIIWHAVKKKATSRVCACTETWWIIRHAAALWSLYNFWQLWQKTLERGRHFSSSVMPGILMLLLLSQLPWSSLLFPLAPFPFIFLEGVLFMAVPKRTDHKDCQGYFLKTECRWMSHDWPTGGTPFARRPATFWGHSLYCAFPTRSSTWHCRPSPSFSSFFQWPWSLRDTAVQMGFCLSCGGSYSLVCHSHISDVSIVNTIPIRARVIKYFL